MNASSVRNDISNTSKSRKKQAIATKNPVGNRIVECMGENDYAWLSAQTGIPATTLSNYVHRGIASTDNALKLAQCFDVTIDWLLTGGVRGRSPAIASVENADWVEVPELNLAAIDDARKGEEVSRTTFRRDWLHQSYGRSNGLWTTRLPSDYPPLDLAEGDLVVCCDAVREELQERHLCIWRASILGRLLVARFTFVHRGNSLVTIEDGDYWVNPYLLPNEVVDGGGGDLLPVGRILGRPFTRIR
jgi:hypothetical protein